MISFEIRKKKGGSLAIQLLELASDEPLADLLGAATNVVELSVAPETTRGVLVDVAIATKQLDALVSHGDGGARVV